MGSCGWLCRHWPCAHRISRAQYNSTDILLSMSFLVPFVGDGFDSLKDSMLGALALRSQLVPLRCLGLGSLLYLVTFPCGLGVEWERQSPTRKGIPTSALLEEAKAKKHHSRRCRSVPKKSRQKQKVPQPVGTPKSPGVDVRAIKTVPPAGDASGGTCLKAWWLWWCHPWRVFKVSQWSSTLECQFVESAWHGSCMIGSRFAACRLVSCGGHESFRRRAICPLR